MDVGGELAAANQLWGGVLRRLNITTGAVVLAGPYSGSTNFGNAVPSLNVWTIVLNNGLQFSNTTSAAIGGLVDPVTSA